VHVWTAVEISYHVRISTDLPLEKGRGKSVSRLASRVSNTCGCIYQVTRGKFNLLQIILVVTPWPDFEKYKNNMKMYLN